MGISNNKLSLNYLIGNGKIIKGSKDELLHVNFSSKSCNKIAKETYKLLTTLVLIHYMGEKMINKLSVPDTPQATVCMCSVVPTHTDVRKINRMRRAATQMVPVLHLSDKNSLEMLGLSFLEER